MKTKTRLKSIFNKRNVVVALHTADGKNPYKGYKPQKVDFSVENGTLMNDSRITFPEITSNGATLTGVDIVDKYGNLIFSGDLIAPFVIKKKNTPIFEANSIMINLK
jgi:hypothetical protein